MHAFMLIYIYMYYFDRIHCKVRNVIINNMLKTFVLVKEVQSGFGIGVFSTYHLGAINWFLYFTWKSILHGRQRTLIN